MFYLFTLISFLALYATAFSFGALVFQFIQRAFPDSLTYYGNAFLLAGARNFIAALIVAFPLYIFLMWLVWKDTKTNEQNLGSGVRKWFTYITLVVVAGLMLGDLIAVVSSVLGGELAIRFLLKAFTIFGIAGSIFGYYLFDLRRKANSQFPVAAKVFTVVVSVLVVGAVAFGIYLMGTPGAQRAMQFDQRRISDLQQISYAVNAYWSAKKVLPQTFDDLKTQQYGYVQSVQDPKTQIPYEYKVLSETSYELCASFETDSTQSAVKLRMPVPFSEQQWNHGIGRTCFQEQVLNVKTPAMIL